MTYARGYLLKYKSSKLHLCSHAAPSPSMSFQTVSTLLILLLLFGRTQNFRKKEDKQENRMLIYTFQSHVFLSSCTLWSQGWGCLGIYVNLSVLFLGNLGHGRLMGMSQVQNPMLLIQPEICYLSGFKTYQKDLGMSVEITREVEFKQQQYMVCKYR